MVNKKTKTLIHLIILCILGVLSVTITILILDNDTQIKRDNIEVSREKSEALKSEELELLASYFVERIDYHFEKIPPSMSFGVNEDFKEVAFPDYFLFKEKDAGIIGENGYYVYIFSSREAGLSMLNRLKKGGFNNYYLISKTIFFVPNKEDDTVLKNAQKYFDET